MENIVANQFGMIRRLPMPLVRHPNIPIWKSSPSVCKIIECKRRFNIFHNPWSSLDIEISVDRVLIVLSYIPITNDVDELFGQGSCRNERQLTNKPLPLKTALSWTWRKIGHLSTPWIDLGVKLYLMCDMTWVEYYSELIWLASM